MYIDGDTEHPNGKCPGAYHNTNELTSIEEFHFCNCGRKLQQVFEKAGHCKYCGVQLYDRIKRCPSWWHRVMGYSASFYRDSFIGNFRTDLYRWRTVDYERNDDDDYDWGEKGL